MLKKYFVNIIKSLSLLFFYVTRQFYMTHVAHILSPWTALPGALLSFLAGPTHAASPSPRTLPGALGAAAHWPSDPADFHLSDTTQPRRCLLHRGFLNVILPTAPRPLLSHTCRSIPHWTNTLRIHVPCTEGTKEDDRQKPWSHSARNTQEGGRVFQ